MAKAKNAALTAASRAKEDEFFTQLSDIEKELKYYKSHFKGKTVFCNCDDPETSNFCVYFQLNFYVLGLKKLIATHYEVDKPSYKLEIVAADIQEDGQLELPEYVQTPLKQNGDFRSPECIEILKEADIVVTNPPFSLFREYIGQLIEYNKKFLIIGSQNNITYKEVFPLLKNNNIWLGYHSGDMSFRVPDYYEPRATRFWIDENGNKWRSMGNITWYTNLDIEKRHEDMILYKTYNSEEYPMYDNYNAINIDKISEIPMDYDGVMGVPITFMNKYNPTQFKIVGLTTGRDEFEARPIKKYINPIQVNPDGTKTNGSKANTRATILLKKEPNGIYYTADNAKGKLKIVYARILIQAIRSSKNEN